MPDGSVHTVPQSSYWTNEVEGSNEEHGTSTNRADAIAEGRRLAVGRHVQHVIHHSDGSVEQVDDFRPGTELGDNPPDDPDVASR